MKFSLTFCGKRFYSALLTQYLIIKINSWEYNLIKWDIVNSFDYFCGHMPKPNKFKNVI